MASDRGRNEIMGPIDYSTNYVCGLLVDGFQFPPTLLTSHNPPYYSTDRRWGFEKRWTFTPSGLQIPPRLRRLRRLADALKKERLGW